MGVYGFNTKIVYSLKAIEDKDYLVGINVRDCILNFVLHKSVQNLIGVGLSLYKSEKENFEDEVY